MSKRGAVFARFGTVTARQLTEPIEWSTSNGDMLRGEPGDWLITAPDGGRRTAKDAQFRDSYHHVSGDAWERIGLVTAWQTQSSVTVETLEGAATARPGDWIVTAPDGATWPVPDEVFRRTYRPVVVDAGASGE